MSVRVDVGARCVRVAVPGGAPEPLTYAVPPEDTVPPEGARVLVPLGNRRATGFVVEVLSRSDVPEADLRSLLDVLDVTLAESPGLLALARFVSDYYVCPLGEVLRAVHPGGPVGSLVARITPEGRAALSAGEVRGSSQQRVLEALATSDALTTRGLERKARVRGASGVVRALAARGWVQASERLAESAKALTTEVHRLADGAGREDEAELTGRSPVRQAVLQDLRRREVPAETAEIVSSVGRPRASVRAALLALREAGAIVTEVREVLRRPSSPPPRGGAESSARQLTPGQEGALRAATSAIEAGAFDVLLLEGVTGSGKTEVYLRALAQAVARGRTGIYLVPEIALTPLLLRTVRDRFGERTAVLHSGLSPGERHDERGRIQAGDVDVVLGARSAVFAPLPRLGLIVVDEEHESSYKQDQAPRYHARDVAVMRGRIEGAPVLLGSATPSLESYRNALSGRYRLARLAERVGGSRPALVEIVDMRAEWRDVRSAGPLSRRLRQRLDAALAAGQQALILLNRRGWADFLLCRECGEPERCLLCSVSLTVHLAAHRLVCHWCDAERPIPDRCRACAGTFLQQVGEGTEQLEAILARLLPGVSLARLDRDTARRRGGAERILSDFEAGRTSILLGTQMIAKAHDFPGVTVVGVLQADRALWMPDFRAAERTFQLLAQVAGRAGRRLEQGHVVVQSHSPDHPALTFAAAQDYPAFYEAEASGREALGHPPFASLTTFLVSSEDRGAAEAHAALLGTALRAVGEGRLRVAGPAPAPLARIKGRHRFHVLVKSTDRRALGVASRAALAALPRTTTVTVDVDVDAQSLL